MSDAAPGIVWWIAAVVMTVTVVGVLGTVVVLETVVDKAKGRT